ncbi:MAG: presenilin family intramembrane aspartyl protease [Candidatus Parcubacteria bacterium]|nr:presenilin family intramembrane aspartyl protease [Candidatus Parcubacteria bacterium]
MKLSWRHFVCFSFVAELFCFAFTIFLAIGVALNLGQMVPAASIRTASNGWAAWEFLITFLIASLCLFLILKYVKKPWLVKVLFCLAIIEGLWLFSQAYFVYPYNIIFLVVLFIYWYLYKNVLIHDILIMFSLSAIAVIFGGNIMPSAGILILIFLAVYDFWAVYKTSHMVQMFQRLAESKAYFTIIIPQNYHGLFRKIQTVSPETEFMFLGTGDLAIPAMFVVSCLQINLLTSLITGLGTIFGFILLYIIFVTQKERRPMPGLPPIVLGTLLGNLLAQLIMKL